MTIEQKEFLGGICPDSPPTLTSAGVDLQLTVDVALVHQRVQHVQHAVHIPDLRVVPQEVDLLLRLLGCLAAVLAERLELVKVQTFIYLFGINHSIQSIIKSNNYSKVVNYMKSIQAQKAGLVLVKTHT